MKIDWQVKFWQSLDEQQLSNRAQLERHVIEQICVARKERNIQRVGGEYLPLSRWHALGYDTKAIEENGQKKWHDQLKCHVFKIAIESEFQENVEEAVRKELHVQKRVSAGPSPSPEQGGEQLAIEDPSGDGHRMGDSFNKRKKSRSRGRSDKKKSRSRSKRKDRSRSKSRSCGIKCWFVRWFGCPGSGPPRIFAVIAASPPRIFAVIAGSSR